ncbi:MAG: hypothetical protein NVS9B2_13860 [Steroidobacteraceae bacterium]
MNPHISTKLSALAVALMMNSLLFTGVAYLFNRQVPRAPVHSLAHATVSLAADAV